MGSARYGEARSWLARKAKWSGGELSTAWFANAFIAKAAGETMEYAWAARARKQ